MPWPAAELICTRIGLAEALVWCRPHVAHMRWNPKPVIRRVARWVEAVRKGKPDRKTIDFPAEFVQGGSIGPVRKG